MHKTVKIEDKIILMILSIILLTFLRAVVIVLMPLMILVIFKVVRFRVNNFVSIALVSLFLISSFLGIAYNGTTLSNVILSGYIMMPLIILATARPIDNPSKSRMMYHLFMKYSTRLLYVVNTLGFISYIFIWKFQRDDALTFAYGYHFDSVHGLANINLFMFFYYFSKLLNDRRSQKLIFNTLFFFISFIFCFYGLGLICFFLTVGVFLLLQRKKKIVLGTLLLVGLGGFFISQFNARNFRYIEENVEKVMYQPDDARKVLMYMTFWDFFRNSAEHLVTGVGPGGYNGRVSFLLNQDSNNLFTNILGHQMPVFHRENAYVFWNKSIVSFEKHTDGTRNKPFSSVVSVISEYGIIFFVVFFWSLFSVIKSNYRYIKESSDSLFIVLSVLYMLFLLFFDMWLETSEFLFFVIFLLFHKNVINEIDG